MAIRFALVARAGSWLWPTPKRKLLQRSEAWLSEHSGHLLVGVERPGEGRLRFEFFPTLGYLDVAVRQHGRLELSAETSPVGPGYHVWACKLARAMGIDLRLRWREGECRDDTGFWQHDDELEVECAMGDFAREELGEADAFAARALFPWWERGHPAEYYLTRARISMERELTWEAPSTPEELAALQRTHEMLLMARSRNPQLGLPWADWLRILDLLDLRGTIRLEVEREVQRGAERLS